MGLGFPKLEEFLGFPRTKHYGILGSILGSTILRNYHMWILHPTFGKTYDMVDHPGVSPCQWPQGGVVGLTTILSLCVTRILQA